VEFLIATGGEGDDRPAVVSLDLDNPRVSQDDGEALFDSDGDPTDFLNQKIALLDKVYRGLQHSSGFIDTLLQHELLEQITVDIAFNDGSKKSLQGFYVFRVFTALQKSGFISSRETCWSR
jgi:hypothetical protein